MRKFQLLRDCFETLSGDELRDMDWLIPLPPLLVKGHADNLRRAQRELAAAVALAHSRGKSWEAIAEALDIPVEETQGLYPETE